MKNKEYIHDYFDMSISTDSEQKLFDNLAHDKELRKEFTDHIRLQQVSSYELGLLHPPSHTTGALFDKLGIATPIASSAKVSHTFWKSKGFTGIVSALAGALVTATIMWFMIGGNPVNSQQFAGNDLNNNSILSQSNNEQFPTSSSMALEDNEYTNSSANNSVNANKYSTQNNRIDNYHSTNNSSKEQFYANSSSNNVYDKYSLGKDFSKIDNNSSFLSNLSDVLVNDLSSGNDVLGTDGGNSNFNQGNNHQTLLLTKYITEARSNYFAEINKVQSLTSGVHDNFAFDLISASLLYKLNDNHFVGAIFGAESYSQRLEVLRSGNAFYQTQTPNLYYVGAMYRYMPFSSWAIMPIIDIGIAATQIGPRSSAELGFIVPTSTGLSFKASYGVNAVFFNYQDALQNTLNRSLIFGINYNF